MVDHGALLYLTMLDIQGFEIYNLNLSRNDLNEDVIRSISSLAHGFQNTIDLQVTSMQYQSYRIYFRRTSEFLSVLLTTDHPTSEELVTNFFNRFIKDSILNKFVEFALSGMTLDRGNLDKTIFKLIYNLNFMNELTDLKKEQSRWRI